MSKFSLAGLLRVRTVQEEQARRDLGVAQVRLSAATTTVEHRQAALAAAGAAPGGPAAVFLAGAAARASMAASVGEAVALREASQAHLEQARSEWLQARMRHRAIERLEERHRAARAAERAAVEQTMVDDLTGARYAAAKQVDVSGTAALQGSQP
jgi:flagellar FliJ protein